MTAPDTAAIRNLADLCAHFGAERPAQLNRRLYKDTECGAWISLYFDWRDPLHNGDPQWESVAVDARGVVGFQIGTIIEGSDAEVVGDVFRFPVAVGTVDEWIEYMEAEADRLWKEANEDE